MHGSGPTTERVPASLGPFYVWRRGWPLPPVSGRLDGQMVVDSEPPGGPLGDIPAEDVARRLAKRHTVFRAQLDGALAAYGWSASELAHIGGLDLHFAIPPGHRYLWDFVTMPAYRGRGIYPLLLQEILRRQADEADWFWIGHEPTNDASRRGILKAGFRLAGHVWRLPDGTLAVVGAPDVGPDVARHAARVLGLRHLPAPPNES